MKANEIDMIPEDFRKQMSLRRLLSNFSIVCVGLLCLIATARITLAYLKRQDAIQLAHLEQQQQTMQQSQTKAEEFRKKKLLIEQQINSLDQLRGRDRAARFLNAIDLAYSQGIWLERMHFMRRPGSARNAGIKPGLDLTQGAEIAGHATNHTVLAGFMNRLAAQPGVTDLRLVNTGTHSYANVQVVDFSLALQVDEKAQVKP